MKGQMASLQHALRSAKAAAKRAVKRVFALCGIELIKARPRVTADRFGSAYHNAMMVLLSHRIQNSRKLRIAQIGANDGLINDPLYEFSQQFSDVTDILLIEPQTILIDHLKNNYAFHPSHVIFNGAIGADRSLSLFSIKREVWAKLDVPYAKGWPPYRAPSGVTSSEKEHVARWLRRHLKGHWRTDDVIEEITVPCCSLPDAIDASGFGQPIDVLQVDVEGFDDIVLYNSSVASLRPTIIYFEAWNLSAVRYGKLVEFLRDHGYWTTRQGGDALAVLNGRLPLCFGSPLRDETAGARL
jgi:FkbM family methyltransferase